MLQLDVFFSDENFRASICLIDLISLYQRSKQQNFTNAVIFVKIAVPLVLLITFPM